jgi:hypothetical protein
MVLCYGITNIIKQVNYTTPEKTNETFIISIEKPVATVGTSGNITLKTTAQL